MKIVVILYIALISHSIILKAQEKPKAGTPVIGWDSLENMIQYPEIYRRASVEGAATVSGYIDSTGRIDTVTIDANLKGFEFAVRKAITSIKWYAPHEGRFPIFFNIHFYISGHQRLKVETPAIEIGPPIN